ncbi:MAG: hypothetical protein JF588_02965 [Caulobacterales bacterium]|nr:hypothetical protein [Caulobacterales bacterium]
MLAAGAAVAVVAGVLMGAAMKPDFGQERVLGPQYFSADGGLHQASYTSDPGVSVYRGRIPDYVIGTDWTRPRRETAYAPSSTEPREEPVAFTAEDEPPPSPMVMTYRTWREPPQEASSYPSVDGDVRYRSEAWGDDRYRPEPRDDRYRPDARSERYRDEDRDPYGEADEPPPT